MGWDAVLSKTFLWVAIPGSLGALQVLWERTYLAWAVGPTLPGFGLAHSMFGPAVGLVIVAGFSLLLLWTAVAIITVLQGKLRQQGRTGRLTRRLTFGLAAMSLVFLPFGTLEALPVLLVGPGNGSAALMVEAGRRLNRPLVRLLCKRGVDINARSRDASTALIEAAGEGDIDFIGWLLDQGANPNAVDRLLMTSPLLQAIQDNDPPVVQLLLKKGADPTHRDYRGMSGLDYAQRRGDPEILGAVKAVTEKRGGGAP